MKLTLALCIRGTLGKGTLRMYPSFRVPTIPVHHRVVLGMEQPLPLQGHCSGIHCRQSLSIVIHCRPSPSIPVHPRPSASISIAIVSHPSPSLLEAAHCHPIHKPSRPITVVIHPSRASQVLSRGCHYVTLKTMHCCPLPSRLLQRHPSIAKKSIT